MKWITREPAKVDRIACPWLIKRFVDKDAEILFVPAHKIIEYIEALLKYEWMAILQSILMILAISYDVCILYAKLCLIE